MEAMNKPLASLLVALTLALGAAPALAQDATPAHPHHGHPGARPFSPEAMERRLAHLTERLALDAHQVTSVRQILEATRAQAEALRTTGTPGPERRQQFRALLESSREQIDAVLSEPQRAQFAAMIAERRARIRGRMEERCAHRAGPGI